MNDQTAKADAGKAPLSLVPRRIIYDIARIREYGNQKYGDPDNWKNVEVERYRDAAFRHLLAYLDDPYGIDEESGLPHYWHLACNVAFICEMEDKKTCSPGYSPGVEVREIGEEIVKGAIDAITSKWPRKETERLNKAVELKIDKMSKHQSDFSDLDEEDVTDFDLSGYSDRLWRNAYERGKKEGEQLKAVNLKIEKVSKHVSDFSDLDEEPEKAIGHWIVDGHHINCDICGATMCRLDREGDPIPTYFCPGCGAKMADDDL